MLDGEVTGVAVPHLQEHTHTLSLCLDEGRRGPIRSVIFGGHTFFGPKCSLDLGDLLFQVSALLFD